jgi:drug/metabolite transporter (DMT)-like permease
MNNQKSIGHSAMLMVNIFFGMNMAISKGLMGEAVSPMGLNALRFLFGGVGFWLLSIFFRERVEKKDLGILFLGSVLGLLINQIFFIQGLARTSPIDASIICTSLPIITMLLSALILKEPITWLKALGVMVGASGAIYLVYTAQNENTGASSLVGNLLCFGSCVSFALFLVVTKTVSQKYRPITTMKWMFLFAILLFLPFSFTDVSSLRFSNFSQSDYASLFFVLVFATLIPYLLIPLGQKILRPTTLAMYNYVQPIMASLLAVFIGQDSFSFSKGLAAALVFTGVFIVTRSKSRADIEAAKLAKKLLTEPEYIKKTP